MRPRARICASSYVGRACTWRNPHTDQIMHGQVEKTDDRDRCYVRTSDGKLFLVELFRIVWGIVQV